MNGKNIERNDPCPCGSGKKYKKCCYQIDTIHRIQPKWKDHFLPSYDEIDYGEPRLDDHFFEAHKVHEISAPHFLYSTLLMPEVEEFVSKVMDDEIVRSRAEKKLIEDTEDAATLVRIMGNEPDIINHTLLKRKILERKTVAIPLILEELKKKKNTIFYELAVKILKGAGDNFTDEVVDIIKHHQKTAYAVSLLSILLGFYNEKEKSVKLLWDLFHYFRENHPEETYSDGPLIALLVQRAQDREKMGKRKPDRIS
jgi:hypothetical protein